jgi:hypothetical protein
VTAESIENRYSFNSFVFLDEALLFFDLFFRAMIELLVLPLSFYFMLFVVRIANQWVLRDVFFCSCCKYSL